MTQASQDRLPKAMRSCRRSKTVKRTHLKWDGPFVVYEVTDRNTYQLATFRGYLLSNLTNGIRLHTLDLAERKHYWERFWQTSEKLQARDRGARQAQATAEVDNGIRKATCNVLAAQIRGDPAPLDLHADFKVSQHSKSNCKDKMGLTLVNIIGFGAAGD
jgi:K+-sensing histidine kinase KdpD